MEEYKEHEPGAEPMAPANQTSMWDAIRSDKTTRQVSPFAVNPFEEARRRLLARHKLWLESLQHEYPSPYAHYRIGVYIRFFNQTKYENYLLYHKQEFIDTIALCPNWTLVGFYVDEGQSAPYMENAKEWSRLLQDCLDDKIDLIITQKVSNVTRNPAEITLVSRILATQKKPVPGGIPSLARIAARRVSGGGGRKRAGSSVSSKRARSNPCRTRNRRDSLSRRVRAWQGRRARRTARSERGESSGPIPAASVPLLHPSRRAARRRNR